MFGWCNMHARILNMLLREIQWYYKLMYLKTPSIAMWQRLMGTRARGSRARIWPSFGKSGKKGDDKVAETDGAVPGKRHRRGVRPSGEATPILPPGGVRSTLHGPDLTEAGAVRYPPGSADAPRET